jgi:atypical dual specificity phosphatase
MSEITPHVVLGDMGNASSELFFRAWKITHILNCAAEHISHKYPAELPSVCVPLEDEKHPAAESLILTAAGKLEEWVKQGYRAFVHCKAGISRSPTVVMAWLITYRGYSFDDAWCKVVKARTMVYPNPYFVQILKELQPSSNPP